MAVSDDLINDIVAETGATQAEAMVTARRMMGAEAGLVRLPEREQPLIRLILACAGQWRMAQAGLAGMRPFALDMNAVDAIARNWLGITPNPDLLDGLAIVEREALRLMRTDR